MLMSLSGSSEARKSSCAMTTFATWSSSGGPMNRMRCLSSREWMSRARSRRLVFSMTMGMRASGRRLSRSKFMRGSPVAIIGSNSYNPVVCVLTFEYAVRSAFFLPFGLLLPARRRLPRALELLRGRRRLHCIRRFWGRHRTQKVNGLSHQKLVPKVGTHRIGGTEIPVLMAGVILLRQGVGHCLFHLGIGDDQPFALGHGFERELEPDLLHRLGTLLRLEDLRRGVRVLEIALHLQPLLLEPYLKLAHAPVDFPLDEGLGNLHLHPLIECLEHVVLETLLVAPAGGILEFFADVVSQLLECLPGRRVRAGLSRRHQLGELIGWGEPAFLDRFHSDAKHDVRAGEIFLGVVCGQR